MLSQRGGGENNKPPHFRAIPHDGLANINIYTFFKSRADIKRLSNITNTTI